LAGMCAARVLGDFFDTVTVFDRDRYPDDVAHRTGVPQSHHAHALLARGQRELERLFPGFERTLVERGAHRFDFAQGFAVRRKWGWAPRCRSGLEVLWASRPLVESVVRERLRRHGNIALRERTTVDALRTERRDRLHVTGVRATPKGEVPEEIAADLVVDASGRGSKAPSWLAALGLPAPEEDVVEAYAGYASRFYRRPPAARRPAQWWWDGLWIEGVPPDFPRGGVAFPVEDHRWLVTAVGFCKDYPPTDEKGFVEFLESLTSPLLAQAIRMCEPLGDIVPNRSTTNRFRHYESWRGELDGFVAVGDGVCAFNPVYGQGMSTAAVCAATLEKALHTVGLSARELPKRHFRDQAKFLSGVWNLSAGADFVWPTTVGTRPLGSRLFQPYFELLGESAHCDPAVLQRITPIFHLIDDPNGAASPAVVLAVLGSTLRRRLRQLRAPVPEPGPVPPSQVADAV